MRSLIITFVSLSVLAGCAGGLPEAPLPVPVTVATVASAQIPTGLTLTGTLTPAREAELSAKATGKLVYLGVDTGSLVRAGELLARVETDTDTARSSAIRSDVGEVDKDLAALRALYAERYGNTLRDLERVSKTLDAQIAITETQLAEAEGSGRTRSEALGQAAVELAERQLASAKETLEVAGGGAQDASRTLMGTVEDRVDGLLGVTQRHEKDNDGFESALGTLDATAKTRADDALRTFLQKRQEDTAGLDGTLAALAAGKEALEDTHTLLLRTQPVAALPQATLEQARTDLRALTVQAEQAMQEMRLLLNGTQNAASIAVLEQQVANSEVQKKERLAAVESDIIVLRKQLDGLRQQKDAELRRLQDSLALMDREQDAEERALLSRAQTLTGEQGVALTAVGSGSVFAPFDGVVTEKLTEMGSVVGSGIPIVRVAERGYLKLTLSVPDSAASAFAVGKRAEVRVDGVPDRTYAGSVTQVLPEAMEGSKKLRVEITVAGDGDMLKVGMFARAVFALGNEQGLVMPEAAAVSRYGRTYVFVVQEGRVEEREITPGRTEGGSMLVVAGLRNGEQVVTGGGRFLSSGTAVTIR